MTEYYLITHTGFYRRIYRSFGDLGLLPAEPEMTHMELVIQGNFLGLIKAEVFVSSAFSLTFLGSKFYCKVSLDLNGLNNVRKWANS